MKRKLPTGVLVTAFSFSGFMFISAAQPALLFAEAGFAPPACSTYEADPCAAKALGDTCTPKAGGAGLCFDAKCFDDAGASSTALECRPANSGCGAAQSQLDSCVGKKAGDACDQGAACGVLACATPDGGTEPELACLYTGANPDGGVTPADDAGTHAGDGGSAATSSSKSSCALQSGSPGSGGAGAGAGLGLGLGIAALFAARRKRNT